MAYSAGDTILDDEYNAFVDSSSDPFGYNHFAGAGAADYGLNQSSISTVSAGDTVAASSWNALFTGMDNIANHTNVSITASSVSGGRRHRHQIGIGRRPGQPGGGGRGRFNKCNSTVNKRNRIINKFRHMELNINY